jgi:DNA-binding transcriptional regulator YiaG
MTDTPRRDLHPDEIQELRRLADWTIEEFAAALDMPAEQLRRMEAGEERIPAEFDDKAHPIASKRFNEVAERDGLL